MYTVYFRSLNRGFETGNMAVLLFDISIDLSKKMAALGPQKNIFKMFAITIQIKTL